MANNFQITEHGRQVVGSLRFALELKKFLGELHEDEQLGGQTAFALLAWALTGHDIDQPPQSADEQTELVTFLMTHRSEVKAAEDACLETLARNDSRGNA